MTQRAFAETALRQAQKVEALGQLASGIAHDFNNLLTVITGNLEMLRDRVAGTAVAEERFGMAMSAAERSEKLIRSLLAFARQEPLEIKVFDVNKCLVELQPLLRHALPSSIDLVLETAALPALVETDIGQTETALLNLVVNARDAMPRGGVVRVTISCVSLAGEPDALRGEFAAVSVADSGEGMTPQTVERVFEPFFTTKPPGKGTGLGLSMVHSFAKKSGGGIAIRSAVGVGTEVVLYLPHVAD